MKVYIPRESPLLIDAEKVLKEQNPHTHGQFGAEFKDGLWHVDFKGYATNHQTLSCSGKTLNEAMEKLIRYAAAKLRERITLHKSSTDNLAKQAAYLTSLMPDKELTEDADTLSEHLKELDEIEQGLQA